MKQYKSHFCLFFVSFLHFTDMSHGIGYEKRREQIIFLSPSFQQAHYLFSSLLWPIISYHILPYPVLFYPTLHWPPIILRFLLFSPSLSTSLTFLRDLEFFLYSIALLLSFFLFLTFLLDLEFFLYSISLFLFFIFSSLSWINASFCLTHTHTHRLLGNLPSAL